MVPEAAGTEITAVGADGSGTPAVPEVAATATPVGQAKPQAPTGRHAPGTTAGDISVESCAPQWTRLVLEFRTGLEQRPVVVRVSQLAADDDGQARVDNLGLLEAD